MLGQNLSEEERAVMKVIATESSSFYEKDLATFERCWAHEPQIRRLGWWSKGGIIDIWGWDELKRLTIQHFVDYPVNTRDLDQLRRENLVVQVDHGMAYATFDECVPCRDPDFHDFVRGRAGRVLRKIEGDWRIVYSNWLVQTVESIRAPMFRVNRDSAVGWMNTAAETAIKRCDALSIVAGRLVANGTAENRQMRNAIRCAAERDESLNGLRACIPVLLRQESDDDVCVCWVVTEGGGSGAVLVSLNNLTFAQDKLDAASAVFGLSQSQQRLAELIASGHDVVASAGLLGITANTAKTHLQRIYDKTGVRSQAALIRTLLSIERPE